MFDFRKLSLPISILLFQSALPAAETPAESLRVEAEILGQAMANIEKMRKGDAEIVFTTSDGKPARLARVEVEQTGSDFLVGCIIFDLVRDESPFRAERFKERFKGLFNFAVFPFYWAGYEDVQGMTRWREMMPALEWCRANGITAKGHPLVWTAPSGKPDWLANYSVPEQLQFLESRVKNVVGGCAGRIEIWDVFNEAVNTRAWDDTTGDTWRPVPPATNADLVEKAFRWAHRANPASTLILNEYYVIAKEDTRERFYQLVKELLRRGTPISGLGIQAHEPRQEWYPPREVWKTFDRLGEFGLPLHITEFTPQSSGKPITGGWRTGEWDRELQADFTQQMFTLAFGHPAVVSFNFWGLSDRNSWLPE
ncbi:MAG: endo-1,4-beta-xylanase, partial [Candidatus Glassbacteria bacterium]